MTSTTSHLQFYVDDKYRKETIKSLKQHFDDKNCKKIERGIYDFANQFCNNERNYLPYSKSIYMEKFNDVMYNCNNENNLIMQKMIQKINKGKYNSYNIAFLRPDELDPKNWEKILQKKENIENTIKNESYYEWKPCIICKNTKYSYRQLQTRSADEPMTIFYICNTCGKTTRINN